MVPEAAEAPWRCGAVQTHDVSWTLCFAPIRMYDIIYDAIYCTPTSNRRACHDLRKRGILSSEAADPGRHCSYDCNAEQFTAWHCRAAGRVVRHRWWLVPLGVVAQVRGTVAFLDRLAVDLLENAAVRPAVCRAVLVSVTYIAANRHFEHEHFNLTTTRQIYQTIWETITQRIMMNRRL